MTDKTLENRVRAKARRYGMRLMKARGRTHINNRGGYQLIAVHRNYVLEGVDYDLTLTDAEHWIDHYGKRA